MGVGFVVRTQTLANGDTIVFGPRSSSSGAALTLTLIENMKGDTPATVPVCPPSVMISARAMLSARLSYCLSVFLSKTRRCTVSHATCHLDHLAHLATTHLATPIQLFPPAFSCSISCYFHGEKITKVCLTLPRWQHKSFPHVFPPTYYCLNIYTENGGGGVGVVGGKGAIPAHLCRRVVFVVLVGAAICATSSAGATPFSRG